ncbi:amino acid permease [Paenibacillus qinlingensis]|uniref:APA family basic amino acid/polyamine antiporter n=1 Tax=Paenibacillus qinlingensis TaxID=1837343 RepID=A0ABU1NUQ0_9BACL|nr:amino acid permease [Paenibacillus qinlingensis]MDR6551206.1 APA family basic amino acid/polyamine antiporter [Paenibacillus qinlingensis]
MGNEIEKLKQVLGLRDAIGIAIGQMVGAGILSITGLAIALTGTGVPLAFLLSSVFMLIITIPLAILGSVIPTTGGMYAYTARLLSPQAGFVYLSLFTFGHLTIAVYAISFAQYFQGIVASIPIMPVAFVVLTFFYLINLFGIKFMSTLGKVLILTKLLSLMIFVAWGMSEVDYSVFQPSSYFPQGISGFLMAVGMTSFASGGAYAVVELGGEMKRPKRDIPLAILISSGIVGVLYIGMGIVATGVLPISEVAGESLIDVATSILPRPLFLFFVIGGAMFALASTLNVTFSWVTRGMLVACRDGWLPAGFGKVNRRFGTPHWLLTFYYILGIIPIVTGVSLATISQLGVGILLIASVFPVLSAAKLPRKYPDLYRSAPFTMKPVLLYMIVVIAVGLLVFQGYLLLSRLSLPLLLGNVLIVVIAASYAIIKGKTRELSAVNQANMRDIA